MGLSFGLAFIAIAAMAVHRFASDASKAAPQYKPRPFGSVTFNKHVAPIIFENCASCHRPGESAPFSLLTYADAKARATLIAKTTHSGFMPPWLPEDGFEELQEKRGLSVDELGLIDQWVREGARQGEASDLPPQPKWTDGWQLGTPDLVVTMPETYFLPAEGKDVYRNFIIPLPATKDRFVRAFEFRPSSVAVHHAFFRFDRTRESRNLAKESTPGFAGMTVPPAAESVMGHFLSWQPGRGAARSPGGLPWTLPGGADIVVLMHMQPSGKTEPVRSSIAFYFTDAPPTNTPIKIGLRSYDIDIPANATDYVVERTETLPVDAELLAVLPHAHYLGKRIEAFAILPDQSRKTLLRIPDWDLNWQSEFRFARPIRLPKGTSLGMRYVYDNSINNFRNPFYPPQTVRYGLQTTDEMAELYFQLITHDVRGLEVLKRTANEIAVRDAIALNNRRLLDDPGDAEAILEIAKLQMTTTNLAETAVLVRRALGFRPDLADGHYTLGVILMEQSRLMEAERELLATIRLDPRHYKAINNVGLLRLNQGRFDEAAAYFQEALEIHPGDRIAQANLELARQAKHQ